MSVSITGTSGSIPRSCDVFSAAFIASSSDVAAATGPHDVSGTFSSKGSHSHASPPVAAQRPLVSSGGRPSQSNPFVAGLRRSGTVVAPGGQVAVRSSPAGSAPISVVVYQHVPVGLGAHLLDLTAFGPGWRRRPRSTSTCWKCEQ